MTQEKITLIGCGLVGSLLALFLGRQGYAVDVFEKRADLRKETTPSGRSINLALANRGIVALKEAGVFEAVKKLIIPMKGREIHELSGKANFQRYGQRKEEVIYSISRGDLNKLLMDYAEGTGNVNIYFNQTLERIDLDQQTLTCQNHGDQSFNHVSFHRLIGTDGYQSKVRQLIQQRHSTETSLEPLAHGYKELTIKPDPQGQHQINPHALHVWPREKYMTIALPNLDGSFTVTAFLPHKGEHSFDAISEPTRLNSFFKTQFKDLHGLVTQLDQQFAQNPVGSLATVRCNNWRYKDKLLILGDAAHAIVPFHGQGMNCGFEDCLLLNELLTTENSWQARFEQLERQRKPNADAIAEMSLANYREMSSDVLDPKYRLKQAIAFKLEAQFPADFIPRYSMVMFHRIPYHEVQQRSALQSKILDQLSAGIDRIEALNLPLAQELVMTELKKQTGTSAPKFN